MKKLIKRVRTFFKTLVELNERLKELKDEIDTERGDREDETNDLRRDVDGKLNNYEYDFDEFVTERYVDREIEGHEDRITDLEAEVEKINTERESELIFSKPEQVIIKSALQAVILQSEASEGFGEFKLLMLKEVLQKINDKEND